jgi:undecaprenyl diphosphate synthase
MVMTQTAAPLLTAPEPVRTFVQSGALQHIAIIMDGNRRWAGKHHQPSAKGHYAGYRALKDIVEYCSLELQLPALTVYAFSTENWRRSEQEVNFLLKLFHETLQAEIDELIAKNVRLKFIGNIEAFPKTLQDECRKGEERTAQNTGMLYQVALSYGGRSEIVESCKRVAQAVKDGTLNPADITEDHIRENLYTKNAIDPDMIIRTGGEYRLSNFLMWQSAYSEIYVLDELWPEFTPEVLNRTILDFQQRQRRFGR